MGEKIACLNLGQQPLANKFLTQKEVDKTLPGEDIGMYNLEYQYDIDTHLFSMINQPPKEDMFNNTYPYDSSGSQIMVEHFKTIANKINKDYVLKIPNDPFLSTIPNHSTDKINKNILEIGSNNGPFISNIDDRANRIAVEPCDNFAQITNDMGIPTYNKFWNKELSYEIMSDHGLMDVVYAANCMCHISDIKEAFYAVRSILNNNGVFIFEDPYLLDMLNLCSYDSLYDEHFSMFSIHSLTKLLNSVGLYINKIEHLDVHGGSIRIYTSCSNKNIDISIDKFMHTESLMGINKPITYKLFGEKVNNHRILLLNILEEQKSLGKKIISYGATSKSTTIFNYCGIGPDIIDYITDTTVAKQDKYSPGVHIPIISPEEGLTESVGSIFLGAWNFADYIMDKEKDYAINKKWIINVPFPRIV